MALTWAVPASNGGAAITGYNVYRGTSPGGEAASPVATNVTTTSFTDTGLTNGTAYYYKVAAVNAAGTSPQSGEASATPQSRAGDRPVRAPHADRRRRQPVRVAVVDRTGLGRRVAVTGYNVYRSTTAGGEGSTPVAAGVKATTFTDSGLTNQTTYFYTVKAVNAVGVSSPSGEVSVTPHASAPSAPQSLVTPVPPSSTGALSRTARRSPSPPEATSDCGADGADAWGVTDTSPDGEETPTAFTALTV